MRTKLLITLLAVAATSTVVASGILPAPRVVEASDYAFDGAVIVTWTSVPGAKSYRVYRNTSDDWLAANEIGVTSDTAFIDPVTSRHDGQACYYWIAAEAGLAVSPISDTAVGHPGVLRPGASKPNTARLRQNFRRLRGLLKQSRPSE
ncbi:MAG: hypothetical protein HKN82_03315 [Akkermansiaceae bacterium]|nr:hypothetical protein [Akkermansiaceae bacterium]